MTIIEALKAVKSKREKVADLCNLISKNAAHMESTNGKTPYDNPKKKINEWVQSAHDTQMDISSLLSRIQKTNLVTEVTIEMPSGVQVTKSISEWIIRRREGVDMETQVYSSMSHRLTQQATKDQDGVIHIDNVVVNYSTEVRDKKLMDLREEKSLIDSALEIVNATTDLVE